jgi:competence protein CoiA
MDKVILRKGMVRADHFSHKPPVTCLYGSGESEVHHRAKKDIYEALSNHPLCSKCEIERTLDGVRPDISLYIRNSRVAIEVQKSTLDLRTIESRTRRYSELKIHLLWIVAESFPSNAKKIEEGDDVIARPKEWQKYIHALQFGRLYYWQKGAYLMPVHLEPYRYYVEPGNWVEDKCEEFEGTHWYEENQPDAEYGGYWRISKKKIVSTPAGKAPMEEVHIAENFRETDRPVFRGPAWTVPAGKLWLDTLQRWW